MKKVLMSSMTWPEVEAVIKTKPTVLVPIGTTETQSRHNPTGYDYFIADRLANDAAKKAKNAIVTPPICFGYSDLFKGFPGTLTLKPETLQNLVYDITECLIGMGLTNIIYVNNHDPNTPIVKHALDKIRDKYGYVFPILWPTKMAHNFGEKVFEDPKKVLIHGNEPSSSLSAYVCPDMIRPDLIEVASSAAKTFGPLKMANGGNFSFQGMMVPFNLRMMDTNPVGGNGDPKPDAEKGGQIFNAMVDYLAAFCDEFNQVDNHFDKEK